MSMDIVTIAGWAIAIVSVVAAVYFRVTGQVDGDFLQDLYNKQQIARDAVAAAQQLWASGQIPETDGEKDARFQWAFDRIQEYYPNISDEQIEMTIEAAVYWLKQGMTREV